METCDPSALASSTEGHALDAKTRVKAPEWQRSQLAGRLWQANPWLSYAYGTFGIFEATVRASMAERESFDDRKLNFLGGTTDEYRAAMARLACASAPLREPDSPPSFHSAVGNSLTLWAYGCNAAYCDPLCEAISQNADAKVVIVRIDSAGGGLTEAFRIVNCLQQIRAKSVAIIDRSCYSAALVIAAGCDHVVMRENASMLIHPARIAVIGNSEQLRMAAINAKRGDCDYRRFICSRRRRVNPRQFEEMQWGESFLNADSALSLGLVDRICRSLPSLAGPNAEPAT